MCGTIGFSISAIAVQASWRTPRAASEASSNFAIAFISSMIAAMAVLKVWRRPRSSPTLAMVSCSLRRSAFWSALNADASSVGAGPAATCACTPAHRRRRKRAMPSTPDSFQSSDISGGEANIENRRTVSAP